MQQIIELIDKSVIGSNQLFTTVFGEKPMIYADYTASGRSLQFIEDYIIQHVLPWYANTHTETSYTGAQTTKLREEARNIIRSAVNANEKDSVIFCGSGATAAVNKLIDILNIRLPKDLSRQYALQNMIPVEQRPVVFVGPYEHHSNELPWRESIADVVSIPLDENGQIDANVLVDELDLYKHRPVKIGSFSAASNVTGVRSNIAGITQILKSKGALSCWDFAAAAPYIAIDMNTDTPIDVAFISPHKLVGGPGTPGILVAKKEILTNSVPAMVGGGTVLYVTPSGHRYIDDNERREEGGTPAIVESIRAGIAFKLQQEVGLDVIEHKEQQFVERALAFFAKIPQIEILGPVNAQRISIFSMRFKHSGKDLHYGFVTALLNDLFGIQVRGGCSCAGPYGHTLLKMNKEYSQSIETEIQNGHMVLRPGWVRMNFNYFISEEEFNFILNAVKIVAQQGWRMLPFYQLDEKTAVWRYQGKKANLANSLEQFTFLDLPPKVEKACIPDFTGLLELATKRLFEAEPTDKIFDLALPAAAEALRWFVLPQECHTDLTKMAV